ncbi:hypothetical protein BDW68DRAFT_94071 [Aspergillus falconensis]
MVLMAPDLELCYILLFLLYLFIFFQPVYLQLLGYLTNLFFLACFFKRKGMILLYCLSLWPVAHFIYYCDRLSLEPIFLPTVLFFNLLSFATFTAGYRDCIGTRAVLPRTACKCLVSREVKIGP